MSKKFRLVKEFRKNLGARGKRSSRECRQALHMRQMEKKQDRKNFLLAKQMLRKSKESVVIGNAFYLLGEDKKSIVILEPDFDVRRGEQKTLNEKYAQFESNNSYKDEL